MLQHGVVVSPLISFTPLAALDSHCQGHWGKVFHSLQDSLVVSTMLMLTVVYVDVAR